MFSIDEPVEGAKPASENADDDNDEWQDVDISEEWGPITPVTQLTENDPHQDFVNLVSASASHFKLSKHCSQSSMRILPPPPPPIITGTHALICERNHIVCSGPNSDEILNNISVDDGSFEDPDCCQNGGGSYSHTTTNTVDTSYNLMGEQPELGNRMHPTTLAIHDHALPQHCENAFCRCATKEGRFIPLDTVERVTVILDYISAKLNPFPRFLPSLETVDIQTCNKSIYFQMDNSASLSLLPPPPPPPIPRCPYVNTSSKNRFAATNHCDGGNGRSVANSVSMPSVRSTTASTLGTTVVKQAQAQTQTERNFSCMRQFLFCLLANQTYRKQRQMEAAKHGSLNSTSRIDSVARILFPLSFGLFNVTYWYSYFHAHKPFDWDDHMLKGEFTRASWP